MAFAVTRDVITIRGSSLAVSRVAVVGAGTAGVEAAKAAAENGGRVILFESGDSLPSPKSSWTSILAGGEHRLGSRVEAEIKSAGIEVQLNQRVSKVGEDLSITVGGKRFQLDAVILATGSETLPERFEGNRKQGVHILDSQSSFVDLSEKLDGYSKAIVSGSGPVAVEVAEKLRLRRVAVSVLAEGGVLTGLNDAPRSVVLGALASMGVQVIAARPDKVVGVDRVEAVVASGVVIPGDCFVVVPRLVPRVPEVQAALGRSGGIIVDPRMQSSQRSVYAAGDCAELSVGRSTMPLMFESSAKVMGAVAGANSAGKNVSSSVVGSYYMELVGVGVASAGSSMAESTGLGLDVEEVSRTWKGELACSIVYSRNGKTVVGVQVAGRGASRYSGSLPIIVGSKMTVEQLAYQENPISSDISPVVETARDGVVKH
jgi:NADPH-dependent 2,4-dienoyl-CoA reductase/sulfur reductase-like enzyme